MLGMHLSKNSRRKKLGKKKQPSAFLLDVNYYIILYTANALDFVEMYFL